MDLDRPRRRSNTGQVLVLMLLLSLMCSVDEANANDTLCFFHGSSYCAVYCGPLSTGSEPNSPMCPTHQPRPPQDPLTKLPDSAQHNFINCGPHDDRAKLLTDPTISCRQKYSHDTRRGTVLLHVVIPENAQVVATFCGVRPGGYNSFRGCLDGRECGVGLARFDTFLDKTDPTDHNRHLEMMFHQRHPTDARDAFYDVFYTVKGPRTTDCKGNPPQPDMPAQ